MHRLVGGIFQTILYFLKRRSQAKLSCILFADMLCEVKQNILHLAENPYAALGVSWDSPRSAMTVKNKINKFKLAAFPYKVTKVLPCP